MFYEYSHPITVDYFDAMQGEDIEFLPHIHYCYEIFIVLEGHLHVEVNEQTYNLREGEAVFIFPNQIHSMYTEGHSRHLVCLFSPNLINAYNDNVSAKIPVNNVFTPDPFYVTRLFNVTKDISVYAIKGLLYSFCDEFDREAVYLDSGNTSNSLLHRIFNFVEQNYQNSCSLSELSKYTGYEYTYLSRYFKKYSGIYYNDYVNQYRISRACYLMHATQLTILAISEECGFRSYRSFNRNFKEQLGIAPAEYRKSIDENENGKPDAETETA